MFSVQVINHPAEPVDYYEFRWRILRGPWDQPRGSERDELDSVATHITVRNDAGDLIGIGRLHFNSGEEAQIRYMATDQSCRKRGVGRRIVRELEGIAQSSGAKTIVLNARLNALEFYERLGFSVVGKGPTAFGVIEHAVMEKKLT